MRFSKHSCFCWATGTGETKKPKAKGVTFDLNLNNTEEMTQETIVKSTSLNDSDSGVGSQNSSAVGISSQDFGDEFDGEFQTTSSGKHHTAIISRFALPMTDACSGFTSREI